MGIHIVQGSGSTGGKSDGSPPAINRMNSPQQSKEEADDRFITPQMKSRSVNQTHLVLKNLSVMSISTSSLCCLATLLKGCIVASSSFTFS
jgi:hypothetical protein